MLKITVDTRAIAAALQATERKIVRCTAIALTQTAKRAQEAVIAEMPRVFDRPTPYTLRGTRVKPADYKSGRIEASVEFKTDTSKGTQAEKYLGPEVFAGPRRAKRFEVALQRAGIMPAGMFAVPGQAIHLDAFGNIPGKTIVQIMSYLQAFGEQGYRANMSADKRAKLAKGTRSKYGYELVVIRPGQKPKHGGTQLAPGIWKRTFTGFGFSLQPLILFVRQPIYRARLPLDQIRDQAVQQHFGNEFKQAFTS